MNTKNFTQDEFSILLQAFNELVKPMPEASKIKTELLDIKKQAENSDELNYRQREAITARVDNYLSGQYGNTKTADNLNYGTPTK